MTSPPVPPFDEESVRRKVKAAQDAGTPATRRRSPGRTPRTRSGATATSSSAGTKEAAYLTPKHEFEQDVKRDVEARVRQGVKAVLQEEEEEVVVVVAGSSQKKGAAYAALLRGLLVDAPLVEFGSPWRSSRRCSSTSKRLW